LLQQFLSRIGSGHSRSFRAGINETERIPQAARNKLARQPLIRRSVPEFSNRIANAGVNGMLSHASKPISRIVVIRFPPVQNAVEKTALRARIVLGDGVGGVVMIVPEQSGATQQLASRFPQVGRSETVFQLLIERRDRLHIGTRTRS
jgi:hypothetical protein